MGNFDRSNKAQVERGVFMRVMYSDSLTVPAAFPTGIRDIIMLGTGATQFDPQTGWNDLGGTRDGLSFIRTLNKIQWGYDQMKVAGSEVDSWAHRATIRFVEHTPELLKMAWAGSAISTLAAGAAPVTPAETVQHFGDPSSVERRRWAFIYRRKDGNLVAYVTREGEIGGDMEFAMPADGNAVGIPINLDFYPTDDTAVAQDSRIFSRFETNTPPA
jgi:hypothetical protein